MDSKEAKEDGEAPEDKPASPLMVLQQISGEAVRQANEAIHNAYTGEGSVGPDSGSNSPDWPSHRRTRSDMVPGHRRASSIQNIKTQIQRALNRGGETGQEGINSRQFNFNPEVLANQKRQWYYQHQAKTPDRTKYKEPTALFEHFIITGLHPSDNLEAVEDAFAKRKKWELQKERAAAIDIKYLQYRGPSAPLLEPKMLFKYPPGKKLPMRSKDICAFCFPGGVKARMIERTPSLSDLNELVYGQEHLGKDDSTFIFSLKAGDNATLFGVCLIVPEIVQRPPGILGSSSPLCLPPPACSRFLVSAPRCYCLLTRLPFFELHYEMLHSIIAQERLNRITQFVREMSMADSCSSISRTSVRSFEISDSSNRDFGSEWMSSAIPIDSAFALSAAAAGIVPNDEVLSSSVKTEDASSPPSVAASEASDIGVSTELDKDEEKSLQHDDCSSDVSESNPTGLGRFYENSENGSPETQTLSRSSSQKLHRSNSAASLSSARSVELQDDDEYFSYHESDGSCEFVTMEWPKKNEFFQIVCGYGALPVPARGDEIVFRPLEHLQPIQYRRPSVSDLGFDENLIEIESQDSVRFAEVNARLAAAEEAFGLSVWTTATICRALCLDSILALITGVLLEKQVVITCPNLGVLSAAVLSVIAMIHPFEWQSLLLPVLPEKMLDFLDAPVPYLVGINQTPSDLRYKISNLVHIDVVKDQMKMCYLPLLPRRKEFASQLRPIHARLACQRSIAQRHPVYKCNEEQAEAAMQFLNVTRRYMESLCADVRGYSITSVEGDDDRVSVLIKDSFIESFPSRDRPFIKLLVDTQMFSVLSDSILSTYEYDCE